MPVIFFIYGMSFLMLGITIAVERFPNNMSAGSFKNFMSSPVYFLFLFGILHGLYEFIDMFAILYGESSLSFKTGKLFLLSLSFYFLCKFGVSLRRMVKTKGEKTEALSLGLLDETRGMLKKNPWTDFSNIMAGIWIILCWLLLVKEGFGVRWLLEAYIASRYLLGMVGAALAAFSLWTYRKNQPPHLSVYLLTASLGFVLYTIGVSVTPKADFYPAFFLNREAFYNIMHMPIQVFRAFCAIVITVSLLIFFRRSRNFSSIRFKAILQIIIAVVIPLSLILMFVSYLIADSLLEGSYKDNEKLASLAGNKISSVIYRAGESVKYSALYSRIVPASGVTNIFTSLIDANAEIEGIAFFDEKGELFRAGDGASRSLSTYNGNADNVRIANFLRGFTIDTSTTNFYIEGYDKDNLIVMLPLPKGHIEILLDLNRLYDIVTGLKIEKGWHILLIDEKGNVALPNDRRFGEKEISEHRFDNTDNYGKTVVENGVYYNAIEGKILPTSWSVVMEIPRDNIVSPVFDVFKVLLFGALIVYLFAIFTAVLFVEKTIKPIDLIARRVKDIGGGDFGGALTIRTGDELQILSEEVEKMSVLLDEKEKIEKQMAQTEKIASLGRLVAGIAHEINNPIGIMLGYSQVLLREFEPGSKHYEDLKIMEKHALLCKKIVEDLLNFSRPDKRVNIKVDVISNIKEALSLVTKHFSKNNISIIFEDSPDSPRIMGDPNKLHQLFLNLAMNAVDAMQDGGKLTIRADIINSEPERIVEVIFKDTGCGISQDDIGKIFDPFFTTKEVGKGTGLGLSVSYGIVKDHKGDIRAESKAGKGSTFYIVFPAVKRDDK
jgi:signal transduction histidine kinase